MQNLSLNSFQNIEEDRSYNEDKKIICKLSIN